MNLIPSFNVFNDGTYPFARLVRAIATTVYVYTRKEFGIRYLKISDLLWSFALARIYETAFYGLGLFGGPGSLNLFPWFFWGSVALSTVHYAHIMYQERAWRQGNIQRPIYGKHYGTSWLAYVPQLTHWGFNQRRRLRFLEPGIVLLLGWLLRPYDPMTGTWFLLAGVCLFIKNNSDIQDLIQRERELLDTRFETEYLNRTLNRNQSAAGQGQLVRPYPPRGAHPFLDEEMEDLAATVRDVMGGIAQGAAFTAAADLAIDTVGDLTMDGVEDLLDGFGFGDSEDEA